MVCRNCVLVKSDALVDGDDDGGVFESLNQMVSEQTRTDDLPIIIWDALRSSIEVTRRSLPYGTLINYESDLATQSA